MLSTFIDVEIIKVMIKLPKFSQVDRPYTGIKAHQKTSSCTLNNSNSYPYSTLESMACKSMELNGSSMHNLANVDTNIWLDGLGMAMKTMNGFLARCLKNARLLMDRLKLVGKGQPLHSSFPRGFHFFPQVSMCCHMLIPVLP